MSMRAWQGILGQLNALVGHARNLMDQRAGIPSVRYNPALGQRL
jgi:hypothetical protein